MAEGSDGVSLRRRLTLFVLCAFMALGLRDRILYNFAMRSILLYNPAAGRFPVRPFIPSLVHRLKKRGWQVTVLETLNGRHATQVARQAALDGYDVLFAIGGDGTVGMVAAGLQGSQTVLGVLPAGTTNVWAQEMGLRSFSWFSWYTLSQNLEILLRSPQYAVDVGLCNEMPFLLWAGLGLDALTVHKLEPRPRFYKYISVPHYAATAVWNATFWHGLHLRVWQEGQEIEGRYLLAVATNIRRYLGGLAVLSPHAFIDDGVMDLWLFGGESLRDTFRHFFALMAGHHLEAPNVRRLSFRHLRVTSETPFPLQLDGEPMLGGREVTLSVLPRALRIYIPPAGQSLLHDRATRHGQV